MNELTTTGAVGGRVARLAEQAEQAAQVRALTTDPNVIALRVEKVRAQVDGLLWAGIVLGLAFTMVNVQSFAAAGSPVGSLSWCVAWLLDPMVSLVLLAVLRAEQVTARYQVDLPAWARRTKWLTFGATYVMNTWTSWGLAEHPLSWSGVVLHSVPPLVVFATAETGPGLRDRLTEAVRGALTEHADRATLTPPAGGTAEVPTASPVPALPDLTGQVQETDPAPVREPAVNPRPAAKRPARRAGSRTRRPAPRRLLADFVTDARTALDTARASGAPVDATPAWCREVTGCSAGTSVKVAAALRTLTTTTTSADRQEAA